MLEPLLGCKGFHFPFRGTSRGREEEPEGGGGERRKEGRGLLEEGGRRREGGGGYSRGRTGGGRKEEDQEGDEGELTWCRTGEFSQVVVITVNSKQISLFPQAPLLHPGPFLSDPETGWRSFTGRFSHLSESGGVGPPDSSHSEPLRASESESPVTGSTTSGSGSS